jgi:hypothetical protein
MTSKHWYGAPQFKVLVCGGSNYSDASRVFAALDKAHSKRAFDVVMMRAAPGASALAVEWALARRVQCQRYGTEGPGDLEQRNGWVNDCGASGVIAFPGGYVTADMIRRMQEAGVPVWRPYG